MGAKKHQSLPTEDGEIDISFTRWVTGGSLLGAARERPASKKRLKELEAEVLQLETARAARLSAKISSFNSAMTIPPDNEQFEPKNADIKEIASTEQMPISGNTSTGAKQPYDGWTDKQDNDILEMKKINKSWKDIVAAVGAPKKDVVRRYKELLAKKDDPPKAAISADDNAWLESGNLDGLFAETVAGADNVGNNNNNNNSNNNNDNDSRRGDTDDMKSQIGKDRNAWQTNEARGYVGRLLTADRLWSIDDCNILEMLVARYTDQKWLHIQSDFYNLTGRMLSADSIKGKFREAGVV